MSDFSLMDAIECGIVKLPRVPVADNIPGDEMPKFRNLWEHIGKRMPKKGRGKAKTSLDPLSLPVELQTALEALYGHYQKTFELWAARRHQCAALLHRRLQQHLHLQAGLRLHLRLPAQNEDGTTSLENGRWRCSATSTSTATRWRARTRC
jgi:type III restriction enzyme